MEIGLSNSFFCDVFEIVKLVPPGRVTSYGAIARYLGNAGSARMVGWALNKCVNEQIPAHRVVNRNGILSGKNHFNYGLSMQELLEIEGIKIENDRIINFDEIFWDPMKELL